VIQTVNRFGEEEFRGGERKAKKAKKKGERGVCRGGSGGNHGQKKKSKKPHYGGEPNNSPKNGLPKKCVKSERGRKTAEKSEHGEGEKMRDGGLASGTGG